MFQDNQQKRKIQTQKRIMSSIKKVNQNILGDIVSSIQEIAFQKNLIELQQKIGLKNIEPKSQTYKDLKHYLNDLLEYPNTQLALVHRKSNRLGNFDKTHIDEELQHQIQFNQTSENISQLQYCPCCGFIRQQEQLKIFTASLEDIAVSGVSTYMYFATVKNLSYFLLLALLLFGVFSFATNIRAADMWNDQVGEQQITSIIKISLSSKILFAVSETRYYADFLIWQAWLGFALVNVYTIAYLYLQRIEDQNQKLVQSTNKSAADYTVVIKGVPHDIKQQQIQKQIYKILWGQQHPTAEQQQFSKIVKISVGTATIIQHQIQLQKKMEMKQLEDKNIKYKKQIVKWIKQLTKQTQFFTPSQIRNQIEKQYIQNKNYLQQKSSQIVSEVKQAFKYKNAESLTACFVTFQSRKCKQSVLQKISNGSFDKFIKYLTLSIYIKTLTFTLDRDKNEEYNVVIQQASEPEDVIWRNIGMKTEDILVRKCVTFLIALLVLGMSFAAVYGLSTIQIQNQSNRYISILISLCISIFNIIILITLEKLTVFQLNSSYTSYQSSLAVKTIFAQLINIIVIPVLVNRFLKKQSYIFTTSGLSEDIFILGIINAFLNPILGFVEPYYFFKKYLEIWLFDRSEKKFYHNQVDLNKLYQLPDFQSGLKYVYIISTYLFTCFFMSLQPIIIVFALGGYFLQYWVQKYNLFHRCNRSVPGTKILYDTLVQFVYAGGLFYSLGSLTFTYLLPQQIYSVKIKSSLISNVLAIAFSTISLFIPYSYLYDTYFNKEKVIRDQFFSQNRIYLPSQYDRMNPATSQQSVKDYIHFVEIKKKQIIDKFKGNKNSEQVANTLGILAKLGRNNYMKSSSTLNYLQSFDKYFNKLTNPAIQVVNPKIIQNYFLTDVLAHEINQNDQNIHQQEEKSSETQFLNNETEKNSKRQRLRQIKDAIFNKAKALLKRNPKKQSNQIYLNNQQSDSRLHPNQFDHEDLPNQNSKRQKTKQTNLPIGLNNIFSKSSNSFDPTRNHLNYGNSPYNPEGLQALKVVGNNMFKNLFIEENVKKSYKEINKLTVNAQRNILRQGTQYKSQKRLSTVEARNT